MMPRRKKSRVLDLVQQVRKIIPVIKLLKTSEEVLPFRPPRHHNPESIRPDMSHDLNANIQLQPQTWLDTSVPAEPDGRRMHSQQEGES